MVNNKMQCMVTHTTQVGGTIPTFYGVIKGTTKGGHKYHLVLEVRMHNNLNLILNRTRFHLQGLLGKEK